MKNNKIIKLKIMAHTKTRNKRKRQYKLVNPSKRRVFKETYLTVKGKELMKKFKTGQTDVTLNNIYKKYEKNRYEIKEIKTNERPKLIKLY